MSAIWGTILYSQNNQQSDTPTIPADLPARMQEPYERKCCIQQYRQVQTSQAYLACGIQYITKESEAEQLPLTHPQKSFYLTADCLLDNRAELMEKLSLTDSSMPDGTIIYHAYLKWGIECVKHLIGLFSLAVYHPETQTLYLATDHTASRCLYYYQKEGQVSFSTLLAPLLAVHPEIQHNPVYMLDYMAAPGMMPNISATDTPYQQVFQLPPATYLTITSEQIQSTLYWKPSNPLSDSPCFLYEKPKRRTASAYGSVFRELYTQCVQDALRCQGEIGISMSSGLDSASVGALAAKALAEQQRLIYTYTYVPLSNHGKKLHGYDILNEQPDVEKILAMYPNMKPSFLNNNGKNCFEDLPHCLELMEIPFKAFVNLPNLCEIFSAGQQQNCKVMLWGQNGNSTVSNGRIDDVLYDLYSKKRYATCLSWLNKYAKHVKESRKQALKGCFGYYRYTNRRFKNLTFNYIPDNPFLNPDAWEDYPLQQRFIENQIPLISDLPIPQKVYLEYLNWPACYSYLGVLETKLGLAYGLVLRDPTKDMRILHFCYHIPYEFYAYHGTPRWLIQGCLTDLLPKELTENWIRYGVQNHDWLDRLLRDYKVIQPEIEQTLLKSSLSKFLVWDKVCKVLPSSPPSSSLKTEHDMSYLLYLYVLGCFLKQRF